MPELPEVETVRCSLIQLVKGRKITDVTVSLPKLIKIPPGDALLFHEGIIGKTIIDIHRRGKYLLLELDDGRRLIIHLRMTGKLLYMSAAEAIEKHTHLVFSLDDGHELRFNDVRQFGAIYLVDCKGEQQIGGLATLGVEPVSDEFTLEQFNEIIKGKNQRAKVFLLDQRFVAGIGNIYADEILFQAGIHPNRLMGSLADDEIEQLWFAIKDRLTEAIAHKGSSIKDYVDGFGNSGEFQLYHKAYGRQGQPCVECETKMERIKVGGRSTVFCPNCQKL